MKKILFYTIVFIVILLGIHGVYEVFFTKFKTLGFINIFGNLFTLWLLYRVYNNDDDDNLTMTT